VADDDAFHIGSNTKGMTALIAGTVVDEGLLTWDSTVGDVLAGTVDVGKYGAVTLAQLLSHSSGIPEVPGQVEAAIDAETMPVVETQRREAASAALALPPASAAGTTFLYSSGNFVIAGLMLEVVTSTSWEDLMTQRLFVPLGMTHAGFGLPGTPGKVDAPWGHEPAPVDPGTSDIAPGFGPAGVVHDSLGDLIVYAQLYLNDGVGPNGRVISEAALTEIETPRLGNYGFGWFVPTDAGVKRVAHSGSNGRFYSLMILFPDRQGAMLMLTNDGTQQSWARVDQVANYFAAHFGLPPKTHSAI
jgi:CubicO group peptidase (beta-lactamase class C family)